MPKQRSGLGRGLDALIPGATPATEDAPFDTALSPSAVFEVPTDIILPNPQQPRAPLGEDDQLLELATSIQQYGLLQPLLVTLASEEGQAPRYQLIAGERRWRAARLVGLERVPVIIRDATPQLMLEMALVENLQRTDLNPLEEAQGYLILIDEYNLTQEQVAERIGRNRATITNTLRLLQLPQKVRDFLIQLPKVFTEGHARAVLQVNGDAERVHLAELIVSQRMSVRQAEEQARRYNEAALRLTPDRRGGAARPQSYETRALEEEFTRATEMKVRLQRTTKGKGTLTLFFTSEEQLNSLYERLVNTPRTVDAIGSGVVGALGPGDTGANGTNGSNGHERYSYGGAESIGGILDDGFDMNFDGLDDDDEG
ncbi:MAG TPA: ParB/RepB/Spo0J family partition protein [Ktedonobacterales bacterium]|nr:ParB/RepB/Spo0J family partition protein [Ktedonobacterales bacterium]